MEKISKPNLVDLLRLSDRERWFCPRIRFASVRSKPCLIADLRVLYKDVKKGARILFLPRQRLPAHVPDIQYDVKRRTFLLDGKVMDVPRISREKPVFSIRHEKYTLTFPFGNHLASEARPSISLVPAAADSSPAPGTRDPPGSSA